MLIQMLMHIEAVPQKMRFMTPSLPQTFEFSLVEVVFQDRHVVRVCTLLDNNTGTLPRTQATDICKTLLGNDDVEIMFRLVNVRAHGHNAGYTRGVGLRGARGRRVHDGVLCASQEICGAAETVEHAGAHDAGGVCVRVDVHFNRRVHSDNTEAADNLGAVGDGLRAEKQLGRIIVPALVEALEAVGGEADGGGGCEV
jgi:hypothetical protein